MVRTKKRKSPSPRYRTRMPLVLRAAAGLALAIAMLIGLAYLVGRKSPTDPGPVDAALGAASSPGIALGIAFGALILVSWCVRTLLLHRLAWRPGRIDVAQFAAGTKLRRGDAQYLTIEFRRQLAALRLQAPTPVPGAAPEGDFLDVLGTGKTESGNILGTLLNLLRAGVPDHAYEIQGTLYERSESPRYSITLQVLELPSESSVPIPVQGDSWEAVVTEAADEATAAILPRTRHCRAPWASWRRRVMPRGLVHAFEEGSRLEADRRYDEALQRYYEAADIDPMNLVLRLRIGHLQERMGLFLDAMATYCGIEATSRPAGARVSPFLYRGAARRQRRRAQLSAHYRRIVLLGGRVLAEQWRTVPTGRTTLRDTRREELRACLRSDLQRKLEGLPYPRHHVGTRIHDVEAFRARLMERVARLEQLVVGLDNESELSNRIAKLKRPLTATGPDVRLRTFSERIDKIEHVVLVADALSDRDLEPRRDAKEEPPQDDDPRFLVLRDLFAQYAVRDARRLVWQLRLRFFDSRSTLTPITAALTAECIRLRQAWIAHMRNRDAQWPVPAEIVTGRIESIERIGWRRSFRLWQEHYNAACAYALALQDTVHVKDRDRLARLAVARLQKATTRADSGYIGSRRDWLLSEDPDLKGLRATAQFEHFEVMFLPAPGETPHRPQNVQQLESSRYMKALLVETAKGWQVAWHDRARQLATPPDVRRLLGWFTDELEMWDRARAVASDYRSASVRLELIQAFADCAARYDMDPLAVAFPRYEDHPLTGKGEACETAAKEEVRAANRRLEALACALQANQPQVPASRLLDELQQWHATLQLVDAAARAPARYMLAQLCDHHAAMWQLLEQWLSAPYGGEPSSEHADRFVHKVQRTRELWYHALAGWLPYRDALDATRNNIPLVVWARHRAAARLSRARDTAAEWIGPHRTNGNGNDAAVLEETAR